MKVTPLELRQRQFTTVMRGYDRAEVNTILAQAADDYEAALLENDRLRQELGKVEAALNEHRGQEKHLSNTLLTAQKLADDIREKAQQDAARLVSRPKAAPGCWSKNRRCASTKCNAKSTRCGRSAAKSKPASRGSSRR